MISNHFLKIWGSHHPIEPLPLVNPWVFFDRINIFHHMPESSGARRWLQVYTVRMILDKPVIPPGMVFFKFCNLSNSLARKNPCTKYKSTHLSMKEYLESRWRNSHVLVYHGPLLIHLLGVVPSTFQMVYQ